MQGRTRYTSLEGVERCRYRGKAAMQCRHHHANNADIVATKAVNIDNAVMLQMRFRLYDMRMTQLATLLLPAKLRVLSSTFHNVHSPKGMVLCISFVAWQSVEFGHWRTFFPPTPTILLPLFDAWSIHSCIDDGIFHKCTSESRCFLLSRFPLLMLLQRFLDPTS
jgi:hypothetical protein